MGAWLVVAEGARPLAVHPGWRTGLAAAVAVVLAARQLAREARALSGAGRGRSGGG